MKVEWISIADKAPDEATDVLVTTEYTGKRYVTVGHRHVSISATTPATMLAQKPASCG